ncbi:hypothetical protein VNO77_22726 [Canavalia gladiata]|uniref:Uncharacterized protein n=1 Tax=Canavalia gladiata TaxID=3824 RepID=A0AAN9L8D5_CANGL
MSHRTASDLYILLQNLQDLFLIIITSMIDSTHYPYASLPSTIANSSTFQYANSMSPSTLVHTIDFPA